MEDQNIKGKYYTVGALGLQAIVLLLFDSFSFGVSVFVLWGLLALGLTGKHYRDTVQTKYLQAWAAFHIAFSIYPLIALYRLDLPGSSQSLQFLLPILMFVTPPIAILIFASSERT